MALQLSSSVVELGSGRAAARRSTAIVIVAAVHAAFLWLFATHIGAPAIVAGRHELQVSLNVPNVPERPLPAPPTDWKFAAPDDVVVPEPEIVIAPDTEADEGIAAGSLMQKLAPRIDPSHPNPLPDLPSGSAATAAAASLVLRLLILPDGTVGDATIARSSGAQDIDRVAVAFVRANWHYLPAAVDGKPVAAWIVTIVHFRA